MLNWVHRQAGPRADIDVAVMQVVHRAIERPPMDQPMGYIKVYLATEHRNDEHQQ